MSDDCGQWGAGFKWRRHENFRLGKPNLNAKGVEKDRQGSPASLHMIKRWKKTLQEDPDTGKKGREDGAKHRLAHKEIFSDRGSARGAITWKRGKPREGRGGAGKESRR